jgi:hypothetical protein
MGRTASVLTAAFAALLTSSTVSADQRAAGPVVVRDVVVREVRVPSATPAPLPEQRFTVPVSRPIDPLYISRPVQFEKPTVPASHLGRGQRGDRSFNRKSRFIGPVIGYPVIYPYVYPYDPSYVNPNPFSPSMGYSSANYNVTPPKNTYSNVESITPAGPSNATVDCAASACGGVSFDIAPSNAQVWVDGVLAGTVGEFNAGDPLLLAPGDHYIEVRQTRISSDSFDVTIAAGQVTPYQGTLERLRLRQ